METSSLMMVNNNEVDMHSLEERVASAHDIAMLRIQSCKNSDDDCKNIGIGFAAGFVPYFGHTVSNWLKSLEPLSLIHRQKHQLQQCHNDVTIMNEEKKDDEEDYATRKSPSLFLIADSKETVKLSSMLRIHLMISRLDPILGEELGRGGSHMLLSKLIQFDDISSSMVENAIMLQEEDYDSIMYVQELACEIATLTRKQPGISFPLKHSPYTIDEIKSRLPLLFEIEPVQHTNLSPPASTSPSSPIKILIHQITTRQSAQEDVGFVMWPSAVVLSRFLMSNPQILVNDDDDSEEEREERKGKTILELGAGCGLTGLVASALLLRHNNHNNIDSSSSSKVIITDFNKLVLENVQRNIYLNNLDSVTTVAELDFFKQQQEQQQQQQQGEHSQTETKQKGGWIDGNDTLQEPVDVIIAADMICQPEDAIAAASTIYNSLKDDGGMAYVVCADSKHRFGVDIFEDECKATGLHVISADDVSTLYDGQLLTNTKMMNLTTGYVDGMTLTLFQITKPKKEV